MTSKFHDFIVGCFMCLLIFVGLLQILIFVYSKIERLDLFPLYTSLWCGVGTLLLTTVSIYLHFGCRGVVYAKSIISVFCIICILQTIAWPLAEALEWRRWFTSGSRPTVGCIYTISLCCHASCWTLSLWATVFLGVVKIRLRHKLALIWDLEDQSTRRHDSTWKSRNNASSDARCFLLNRIRAEENSVRGETCKASRSWRYVLYRSSTPKRKNNINRLNNKRNNNDASKASFRNDKKYNSSNVDGTFSVRKKTAISDEALNKSDPLRLIGIFNPAAVGLDKSVDYHPIDPEPRLATVLAKEHLVEPRFAIDFDQTVLIRRLGERNYRAVSLQRPKRAKRSSIIEKKNPTVDCGRRFKKSNSSASFYEYKF